MTSSLKRLSTQRPKPKFSPKEFDGPTVPPRLEITDIPRDVDVPSVKVDINFKSISDGQIIRFGFWATIGSLIAGVTLTVLFGCGGLMILGTLGTLGGG